MAKIYNNWDVLVSDAKKWVYVQLCQNKIIASDWAYVIYPMIDRYQGNDAVDVHVKLIFSQNEPYCVAEAIFMIIAYIMPHHERDKLHRIFSNLNKKCFIWKEIKL